MGIERVGSGYNAGSTAQAAAAPQPSAQKEAPEAVNEAEAPVSETSDVATRSDRKENIEDLSTQNEPTTAKEQIKKVVDEINRKAMDSEAIFGIHEKTNRVTIKIIDRKTKDVIKEVPPEKTLDLIAKAWELAGLLVDEKK